MQKTVGAIQRLVAKWIATIEAHRHLNKEPIPTLSLEWSREPAWEPWTAAQQIETFPFARKPIRDVSDGRISTTSYPLS